MLVVVHSWDFEVVYYKGKYSNPEWGNRWKYSRVFTGKFGSELKNGRQKYQVLVQAPALCCYFATVWLSCYITTLNSAFSWFNKAYRASLVAQWLRTCLPMQETWVWSLVQKDPRCLGTTRLLCRNLLSPHAAINEAHVSRVGFATRETTSMRNLLAATRE